MEEGRALGPVVKGLSFVNLRCCGSRLSGNFCNLKYRSFNLKARDAINAIPASPINGAKAVLLFDDRLPTIVSSYHQKTMIIVADNASKSEDQPVAYVGGLDLANDRWDTIYHNNSAIRDASGITFKFQGWIDGHIRIHGPAAKDVANNFIPRWNSDYLPSQSIKDNLLDFENPPYEHIPQLNYSIQITRTFSCKYNTTRNLLHEERTRFSRAYQGHQEREELHLHRDQYFIYVPELMAAIMEVMPKIQRLVVVANPQTSAFSNAGYIKYLYEMVSPLREKYPNKFKIRDHDDVYLSVGSANWNRRSMTSDPELNAEVVDGETVKSPKASLWENYLVTFIFATKARDLINNISPSPINGAKAVFLFDDRVRNIASAYHQKTLVITANSSSDIDYQPVAYVGGLDLAKERWDTIYHNNSALRDASGITFKRKGWIDGHIRIHGPAAKDVANNFVARWNSDYLPSQGLVDDLLGFENPPYEDIPHLNYVSSNTTGDLGKQSIQITRTFSCKYKHYKEFAPRGENSLFHARIKAIKNAKNFIYIEDQYFIYVPELLDAIMEVMPKIQRLVVIANPESNVISKGGYIKYLYEMVSPLREKYPNKFKMYTVKADLDLIVHTKVVIIDDVYLSVGSANWNRRSMTSDPELNAEVVDGETVKSPKASLWENYLVTFVFGSSWK
ncbi:Phospholipase D-like domain [Phytophthora cactorum]|nr:Phospholipase D-like domain [Phytophthora cactorum]